MAPLFCLTVLHKRYEDEGGREGGRVTVFHLRPETTSEPASWQDGDGRVHSREIKTQKKKKKNSDLKHLQTEKTMMSESSIPSEQRTRSTTYQGRWKI